MPASFTCSVCGEIHDELPDLVADAPLVYLGIPDGERDRRTSLTTDTCIVDDEHYFIRGIIEIPVDDYPERFGFNVWVSQSRANFEAYVSNPLADDRAPTFGWLSTELSCYPETTHLLKTMVHFRGGALRPTTELEPTDHPLALDQRQGISLRMACTILHHYD